MVNKYHWEFPGSLSGASFGLDPNCTAINWTKISPSRHFWDELIQTNYVQGAFWDNAYLTCVLLEPQDAINYM